MNFRFTVIESVLNRAEFRWKTLRFFRFSLALGVVACLAALGFGLVALKGWVTTRNAAVTFFLVTAIALLVVWITACIAIYSRAPDRDGLGAALERADRRLLDRLNTLLFLERHRADPRAESFARRIARQTQRLVAERPLAKPFPSARPVGWLLSLILLLLATGTFYRISSPLSSLVALAVPQPPVPAPAPERLASQLELPPTNRPAPSGAWGEVRFSEPGRDLKVTRVAVVPLQIEASASEPLNEVTWYTAINGGDPIDHALPKPGAQKYALFEASLDLAELALTNWDVISYFAKATTQGSNEYASRVYFIEIRPFREELAGMPGGEKGKAYEFLKALSGLINQQEQVIRKTHEEAAAGENSSKTEREKLAAAEGDLGDAARNLHAAASASQEGALSEQSLEHLKTSETSLDEAARLLQRGSLADAQKSELSALAQLTAARREFQRSMQENPTTFEAANGATNDFSALSSNLLKQISEFRDEARASQDFVKRMLDEQKRLNETVQSKPPAAYPLYASRQQQLNDLLRAFRNQHPQSFTNAQAQADQAGQVMRQAAEALQRQREEAAAATRQAAEKLEDLKKTLNQDASAKSLAEAYQLKQILEQQMQSLGECSNPTSAGAGGKAKQAAGNARQAVGQLRRIAEEEPSRDSFGEPLRDALGGQNKVDLETALNQLQQSTDETATKKAAGAARDALGKINDAFSQSEPAALQAARQNDALRPGSSDQLSRALADLESLIKQLEKTTPLPRPDQARQGQEALVGIQDGLRNRKGSNQQGDQLVAQMRDALKAQGLDVGDLKRLLAALQVFSLEGSDAPGGKEGAEVTNVDPSRMPPAYRGRIQKYFQKLSEQPR